jgi:hypothetical protein
MKVHEALLLAAALVTSLLKFHMVFLWIRQQMKMASL